MSVSETVPEGSVVNDPDEMEVEPRALFRASWISRGREVGGSLPLLMMRRRDWRVRGVLAALGVGMGAGDGAGVGDLPLRTGPASNLCPRGSRGCRGWGRRVLRG